MLRAVTRFCPLPSIGSVGSVIRPFNMLSPQAPVAGARLYREAVPQVPIRRRHTVGRVERDAVEVGAAIGVAQPPFRRGLGDGAPTPIRPRDKLVLIQLL